MSHKTHNIIMSYLFAITTTIVALIIITTIMSFLFWQNFFTPISWTGVRMTISIALALGTYIAVETKNYE